MWIECALLDGNPVWINSQQLLMVQPSDDNTLLTFVGGTTETVTDPVETVARWLCVPGTSG